MGPISFITPWNNDFFAGKKRWKTQPFAASHLGGKMLNFLILQAIRDLVASDSKMLHKLHKGAFFVT